MELQPHGTDDLQHGAERWIAVLAQRLVEAGPGHAGLLGELTDAAGARDVTQGGGDEGRIVAAFLQAGLEEERDDGRFAALRLMVGPYIGQRGGPGASLTSCRLVQLVEMELPAAHSEPELRR